MKHRNATNSVKATTAASVSPGLSNHGLFSFAARALHEVRHFCPYPLLSDVSHRGPRKYLHQIFHLCVVPFTSFLCSCYIGELCMNSEATRVGLASSKFSRLLFPLETLVVEGLPSLDFPEMVFDIIELSGTDTKVPPIPVATSPTLPSLSKTNSVPVRAILSTMFCLSFRLKALSANKSFLSTQIRFSSEILDCFW